MLRQRWQSPHGELLVVRYVMSALLIRNMTAAVIDFGTKNLLDHADKCGSYDTSG